MILVIGGKNYSSWSLRAWIFLKHVGLEFDERALTTAAAYCLASSSPIPRRASREST